MAAPVIQSYELNRTASSVLSLVVNKPSGVTSGDLLILLFNCSNARTPSCSGFTSLGSYTSIVGKITVFWKVAGGSEPADYTGSVSGVSTIGLALLRITGAADPASNAIEIAGTSGSGSGTATSPSVTPSDNDSLVIRAAMGTRGGNFSTTPSTTLFNEAAGTPNTSCSYETCNATPSGTANFTYTPTWHEWTVATIAIAPSAVTGPATRSLLLGAGR